MSLINCPHCGRALSDQREFCPHCYGELRKETDASSTDAAAAASSAPKAESQKKSRAQSPIPGRCFLGYRHGNPLFMMISIFYHLCALTGILCALKKLPAYMEQGVHYFYLYSIVLAAIMLFLPAVLFSHTKKRQALSQYMPPAVFTVMLFIIYLLLGGLCFAAWTVCH